MNLRHSLARLPESLFPLSLQLALTHFHFSMCDDRMTDIVLSRLIKLHVVTGMCELQVSLSFGIIEPDRRGLNHGVDFINFNIIFEEFVDCVFDVVAGLLALRIDARKRSSNLGQEVGHVVVHEPSS